MSQLIREGDPLILLVVEGWKRRKYFIKPVFKAVYSTFAGIIRGNEIIGKPWGYHGRLGKAEYYLLKPLGPELIEEFGRRTSQVIYTKDSSYIAFKSGIRDGSRVFEAGVGSGFLTIALARIVCPNGMVYGIDARDDMIDTAKYNIELAGVSNCVSLRVGDVREGIGVKGLDAGFLDLPNPWEVLQSAYEALNVNAPLVVFLPTVNQVSRLIGEVEDYGGFIVYEIVELLLREWEPVRGALRPSPRMIGHTGFIVFLRKVLREEVPDDR